MCCNVGKLFAKILYYWLCMEICTKYFTAAISNRKSLCYCLEMLLCG